MRPSQFDPFEEPEERQLQHVAGGSRVVARAGVGLFWMLVVTIVVTRAVYFDQALSEQFRSVASLAWTALTALV